jgi:nucleoid DNA-binding protein
VTKGNIIRTIAEELGLTQVQAKQIVPETFDSIVDILVKDGRVELRNFGIFDVKKRTPRQARNPGTGEKVMVGERFTVTFKPGRVVEERVVLEHRGGAVLSEDVVTDGRRV